MKLSETAKQLAELVTKFVEDQLPETKGDGPRGIREDLLGAAGRVYKSLQDGVPSPALELEELRAYFQSNWKTYNEKTGRPESINNPVEFAIAMLEDLYKDKQALRDKVEQLDKEAVRGVEIANEYVQRIADQDFRIKQLRDSLHNSSDYDELKHAYRKLLEANVELRQERSSYLAQRDAAERQVDRLEDKLVDARLVLRQQQVCKS